MEHSSTIDTMVYFIKLGLNQTILKEDIIEFHKEQVIEEMKTRSASKHAYLKMRNYMRDMTDDKINYSIIVRGVSIKTDKGEKDVFIDTTTSFEINLFLDKDGLASFKCTLRRGDVIVSTTQFPEQLEESKDQMVDQNESFFDLLNNFEEKDADDDDCDDQINKKHLDFYVRFTPYNFSSRKNRRVSGDFGKATSESFEYYTCNKDYKFVNMVEQPFIVYNPIKNMTDVEISDMINLFEDIRNQRRSTKRAKIQN